jgi:hypothetical protein
VFHTLFVVSSNFCQHDNGGSPVDSAISQEDPYPSPCKNVKSITCLVQELCCSIVGVANCDTVAVRSRTFVVKGFDFDWFLTMQRTCLIHISFNCFCLEIVGFGHRRTKEQTKLRVLSQPNVWLVWLRVKQFK